MKKRSASQRKAAKAQGRKEFQNPITMAFVLRRSPPAFVAAAVAQLDALPEPYFLAPGAQVSWREPNKEDSKTV